MVLLRNFNFKNTTKEVGEMAKQSRALVALVKIHIQFAAPTCLTSVPEDWSPFLPAQTLLDYGILTYIKAKHAYTHTHT